jgi:hypothetical protein
VLAERLVKFGKPLAYDGVNLLTSDHFAAEDRGTIDARTSEARTAVDHVIRRGDLRADGAWIYQPWGQFVVAAAGIQALGATTLGARLPFAVAGLATVLLLYLLVHGSASAATALLAAALLVANGAWILHDRQARYYALSSLFLVLTLLAYQRWQREARLGATAFVAAAWCFFQVDYGTVWPVLGVLFVATCVAPPRGGIAKPLAVIGALAAGIAPFVFFYELWGRRSLQLGSWAERFVANAANVNRYVVPMILLAAAAGFLAVRWRQIAAAERRMAAIAIGILAALLAWVPSVAPASFVRYVVMAAPLGAFVTAWLLARLFPRWKALPWAAAAVVAVTPWLTVNGAAVRPELLAMAREVFVPRKDPNAMVVEWLRRNAKPTDEVLINYEDIPLMYYLPNPIRGGIAAFRVEDDAKGPPEFLVLRRSVPFVHWPVFEREVNKYKWERIPIGAPDVPWGNNPDPIARIHDPARADELIIARRLPAS